MAFAATGREGDAQTALDTVKAITKELPADDTRTSTEIGARVLAAELAARAGRTDEALQSLEAARELEDGMLYQEPPFWHQPVRHHLGALLLKAGRAADAEQRYREDLKRFPENVWGLAGLAASLTAQGKTAEAAEVETRLGRAGADVKLVASRF
jgi:predicted Zn-dependent protease